MRRKKLIDIVQKFFHLREVNHAFSIPGQAEKFVLEDPSRKIQFKEKENIRFIAKAAKKFGDQEILTEYLINCVGMAVPGLNISHSRLGVVMVDSRPEVRFMSLFFHGQDERLTHGVQLFQYFYTKEHLDRAVKEKEERHIYTVEDIKAVLEVIYPLTHNDLFMDFMDMCMFDALVGNQDRHAKNWG
ncbi:MAG: HipA domain-containing protein, partial [bacterium]